MRFAFQAMIISFLLAVATAAMSAGMEITPFRTFNQHPTVQLYGLPLNSSAILAPAGGFTAALVQEIASENTVSDNRHEQLVFDGEAYRTTIAVSYGIADSFEAGLNIPYVSYSGGFLDSVIIDWHKLFGLPQGGRDTTSKGAINYSYRQDGVEKLKLNSSAAGIGDMSLTFGAKLYELTAADAVQRVAVRGDLKLPTGAVAPLRGSGSTDLALSLCGMTNSFTRWGTVGLFGSVGGLAMTSGRLLADQHNNLVAFGTAGAGFGPASWLSLKLQLQATTPFYRHSSLAELSKPSFILVSGGAFLLPGNYQLDIGVSEDVSVDTAPDVVFHFALTKTFN